MIEIEHPNEDGIITIRASGKLTGNDYSAAVPELEQAVEKMDRLRLLVRLEDFRGWDIEGFWKELQFDTGHLSEPGRIAVVGETELEKWGTELSAPFASAEIEYFPFEKLDEARHWVKGA